MTPRIPIAAVVLPTVLLTLVACHAGQGGPGMATAADLEPVRSAWRSGNMSAVYSKAQAIRTDLNYSEPIRQEAAYFAGKAASRLKRPPGEVAALMGEAAGTSDMALRGDAYAERGRALCDLEQFDAATRYLLQASEMLSGEAKGQAYFYAAMAEQKLGYWPQARTHLIDALRFTADPGQRMLIQRQMEVTGYTLQLGSFGGEAGARKAAEEWAPAAAKAGLTAPQVVQSTDDAKQHQAWSVRVGQFTTWESAQARRALLHADQAIIVPLAHP